MPNLYGNLSYHGNLKGGMGASLITNVEANPSGDATETLIKIRVGDTIYSIPSGGGGGGGGTTDYNDLTNKPKINNAILTGNLSLSDLGISNPVVMTGATGSSNGVAGYVPQPLIADKDKFLKGDGTWAVGGGGSPAFTELWVNDNAYGVGTYTLNDSINNYDMIEFQIGVYAEYVSSPYIAESKLISMNEINYLNTNSKVLLFTGFSNRAIYATILDTTLNISLLTENTILRVVGIKF